MPTEVDKKWLRQLALKPFLLAEKLVELVTFARIVAHGHHVQLEGERGDLPMEFLAAPQLQALAQLGDHDLGCTAATTWVRSLIELLTAACAF